MARVEDDLARGRPRAQAGGASRYPARRATAVTYAASSSSAQPSVVAEDEQARMRRASRASAAGRRPRARERRGRAEDAARVHPRSTSRYAVGDVGERRDDDRRSAGRSSSAASRSSATRRVVRAVEARRRPRRRAPGARRSGGRAPGGRTRAPRGARSSTGRRGSRRRSSPAPRRRSASSSDASGPIVVQPVSPSGARPTKVSSYRPGSAAAPSARRTSAPLRGLSDQLAATTRTRPPVDRLALRRRVEDRRVGRVRDHDRVGEGDPERAGAPRG